MQNNGETPQFGSRKKNSDKEKKKSKYLNLEIDKELNRPNSSKYITNNKIEEMISNEEEKRSKKKKKLKPKSIFKSVNYSTKFFLEYTYNDTNNPLMNLLAKKFIIRNDFDKQHSEQFLKDKIQIFEGFDVDYKAIEKK